MQFSTRQEILDGLTRLDDKKHILPLADGINAFLSIASFRYRLNNANIEGRTLDESVMLDGISKNNKKSLRLLQDYLNFSISDNYRESIYLNDGVLTDPVEFQKVFNTVALMFKPRDDTRTTQDIEKDIGEFSSVIYEVLATAGGISAKLAEHYISELGGMSVSLVSPVSKE